MGGNHVGFYFMERAMLGDNPGWGLKVRVWVERNGQKVLGPGRVELLGHIDRHRSISAAAKQMNMSYRRAWGLVRDMNEAAGEPLVEVTAGGVGGGGASLTDRGREAIALYQRIIERFTQTAAEFTGEPV
jgi:molybdate transport system regulatory protein